MSARRRTHLKFHEKKVAGMVPLKALLLNSSILHHQNTCNGLQFGAFQYQFNTIRDTMGDKLKQCAYVGSSQAQPHCWQKPVHHLRKLRQRHQALRQRAGHVVCVKRQRPAAKRNGIARRLGRVSPPKAHDKLSTVVRKLEDSHAWLVCAGRAACGSFSAPTTPNGTHRDHC